MLSAKHQALSQICLFKISKDKVSMTKASLTQNPDNKMEDFKMVPAILPDTGYERMTSKIQV